MDLDSLEMAGINSAKETNDPLNLSRPILIQPFEQSQTKSDKLLHLEFETSPIATNADFRIRALSQSLLISYHAVNISFFSSFIEVRIRSL